MSKENVAVVRALVDVWNSGDLDGARELYHPDVIVRTAEGWPEPGPYVGREAVMRWHWQLHDTWDEMAVVPVGDLLAVGDRVAMRYIWRGAGHGPEMNMEVTLVFTMREGAVFLQEFFWDHAEALGTLGLED